jgi:hypothetical protein
MMRDILRLDFDQCKICHKIFCSIIDDINKSCENLQQQNIPLAMFHLGRIHHFVTELSKDCDRALMPRL